MGRGRRWVATVLLAVTAAVVGVTSPAAAAEWHPWANLGRDPGPAPVPGGFAPAIAARSGGAVDLFVGGRDDVYHKAWASGSGWSDWANLGRPASDLELYHGGVSAVGRPGNRISVVVEAGDTVWHKAYRPGWGAWESLGRPPGGLESSPAVSVRPDGTVDVWARGVNGNTFHKYFVGGQGWSAWENIGGGALGAPAATGAPDGSVWVFVQGASGQFYHRVWRPSSGWTGWYNTGVPAGGSDRAPAVAARPNGVIDLYVVGGAYGPVYHRWRATSGTWSGWGSLGGSNIVAKPNAVARPGGALDVVVRTSGDNVYHTYYG